MSEAVLTANGLTKQYHGAPALEGLNLELPKGRIIGLLGPNGSGKTTFIKIAAGLLTPNAGKIAIDGKAVGPETKALVIRLVLIHNLFNAVAFPFSGAMSTTIYHVDTNLDREFNRGDQVDDKSIEAGTFLFFKK